MIYSFILSKNYSAAYYDKAPGNKSLTAVWTSFVERVFLFLNFTSLEASKAILSKVSFINEFIILIAFLEIPMSECTYFNT